MKKLFVIIFLLFSISSSGQWVQMSNGMGTNKIVKAISSSGTSIFAGTFGGVYLSTNSGASWTSKLLSNVEFTSLLIKDNNIFTGTWGSGVWLSTNNGTTWMPSVVGLASLIVSALTYNSNTLFAGTFAGVCISTNNGNSWSQTSLNNKDIRSFAVNNNNIFAGTWGNGVWLSTNNGVNWAQTGLADKNVLSLAVSGNNLFAGTEGSGVYRSTNFGLTWMHTTFNYSEAYSLLTNNVNLFSGGATYPSSYSGIRFSTDSGLSWINKNQGFTIIPTVYSFCIAGSYMYAGTQGQSVWRRSLSEIIGILYISAEIPTEYSLSQNYPNPFNLATKIRFEIPSREGWTRNADGVGLVSLKVFDVAGREIQTLVNEELQPGSYEVTFDGTALNSGVYFYQLVAGSYRETKRMALIK
jgi:hypothetical protein